MRHRHLGRTILMKMLYAMDIGGLSIEHIRKYYPPYLSSFGIVREFVDSYFEDLVKKMPELDKDISKFSRNWSINRISAINRALMRLGLYEMKYKKDIPNAVAIDEALKLADEFSDNESKRFINGILDAIRRSYFGNGRASGRSAPRKR